MCRRLLVLPARESSPLMEGASRRLQSYSRSAPCVDTPAPEQGANPLQKRGETHKGTSLLGQASGQCCS